MGQLSCECGFIAAGDDDDELVAAVQTHARDAHGTYLPVRVVLALVARDAMAGAAPDQRQG